MLNEFNNYKVVACHPDKKQESYVVSNLFVWDMLNKMNDNKLTRVSCKFMNPFCNCYTVIKEGVMFNVYVYNLLPNDVLKLESDGIVKKWKKVYNI